MPKDLAYYRAQVRRRIGVPDDDALHENDAIDADINEALRRLSGEADWPWLEQSLTSSLPANSGSVGLPSDHRRTISVRVGGFDEPLMFEKVSFLDMLANTKGRPRWYGFFAGQLLIRPLTDIPVSVVHRYKRREPDLSTAATAPLLDESYSGALVEGAAALAARRGGNMPAAVAAEGAYQRWVTSMKSEGHFDSPSEGGGITAAAPEK